MARVQSQVMVLTSMIALSDKTTPNLSMFTFRLVSMLFIFYQEKLNVDTAIGLSREHVDRRHAREGPSSTTSRTLCLSTPPRPTSA
jgi:hypothetical protein